jgi:sugar (pentulose or hexulose) kinase
VVVYDLMREAASQLIAQFTARPANVPPSAEAIAAIRAIRAQVAAVEPMDTETQRKLTAELRARLAHASTDTETQRKLPAAPRARRA